MAGIVLQLREGRNSATSTLTNKKRGREGEPGHAFCQREETFANPRGECAFSCGLSSVPDSPRKF
jgi:hypothetical protein